MKGSRAQRFNRSYSRVIATTVDVSRPQKDVFVLATLFLLSAGTFSYDNPLSYYINSRTDWYVAFGVLLAILLISWGVYLVVVSFQHPPKCKE